jgi:hypothetical protein
MPIPTLPLLSPTATSALNPKRRPPLTTFATRFTEINLSTNFESLFDEIPTSVSKSKTPFNNLSLDGF